MKYKNIRYPAYIEEAFEFPDFYRVQMDFARPRLIDIVDKTRKEVGRQLEQIPVKKSESVSVGVGSRGIANIAEIVHAICQEIKERGATPSVLPTMGSHGGATAEGQVKVLQTYGVTSESCGAEIRSSMDIKQIATAFSEVPVYFSAEALATDHSICVNRIKPHTKFKAAVESGVFKMLCIGMGKHEGALAYHKWAMKYGFYPLMTEIGKAVFQGSNFRFGVGVIENAFDETMHIEALAVSNLFEREQELLQLAKENMPRLPVKEADVLIVREIGKELSGAGMDPNITGRAADLMEDDFSGLFKTTRLAILNLSKASKGNALGMGNADIITSKVFEALDYETTLMNILTSNSLKKAAIPVIMPTDEKAIQTCFSTLGPIPTEEARALIIKDTLHLGECWASESLLEEIGQNPVATVHEKVKLKFNDEGNLEL